MKTFGYVSRRVRGGNETVKHDPHFERRMAKGDGPLVSGLNKKKNREIRGVKALIASLLQGAKSMCRASVMLSMCWCAPACNSRPKLPRESASFGAVKFAPLSRCIFSASRCFAPWPFVRRLPPKTHSANSAPRGRVGHNCRLLPLSREWSPRRRPLFSALRCSSLVSSFLCFCFVVLFGSGAFSRPLAALVGR